MLISERYCYAVGVIEKGKERKDGDVVLVADRSIHINKGGN